MSLDPGTYLVMKFSVHSLLYVLYIHKYLVKDLNLWTTVPILRECMATVREN